MVEITDSNFDEKTKDGAVLVDFWASWCGPCRVMLPILEEIEGEMGDVSFFKVNVDEHTEKVGQFGVTAVPSLLFMKDGKVVKLVAGLQTKKDIVDALETLKKL